MSERELQRRKLTGTLASCTVTASVAALGLGGDKFLHPGDANTKRDLGKAVTEFQTELSSKFFQAPSQVIIPATINKKTGSLTSLFRKLAFCSQFLFCLFLRLQTKMHPVIPVITFSILILIVIVIIIDSISCENKRVHAGCNDGLVSSTRVTRF